MDNDAYNWLCESWLPDHASSPRWYLRAKAGPKSKVLASVQLPTPASEAQAVAALMELEREAPGAERLELMRHGSTNPSSSYVARSTAVAVADSSMLAAMQAAGAGAFAAPFTVLVTSLSTLVQHTMASNNALVGRIVELSRESGEIEGFALGRQASPELQESVAFAAQAFASKLAESSTPEHVLQAVKRDPGKLKAAWAKMTETERQELAAVLMSAISE